MVRTGTNLFRIIQCVFIFVISGGLSASFLPVPRSVTPESSTTTPTVQTTYQLSFEITNRVFNDSLLNPSSQDYKKMYNEVNQLLADTLGCHSCTFAVPTYGGVDRMDFRSESGSVKANTVIVFNTAATNINQFVVKFEFLDSIKTHPDSVLQINTTNIDVNSPPVTVPTTTINTSATTMATSSTPLTTPKSTTIDTFLNKTSQHPNDVTTPVSAVVPNITIHSTLTTTNLPRNTSTLTPKVPTTSTPLTSPTESHLLTPTKDFFLNKTSLHPNVVTTPVSAVVPNITIHSPPTTTTPSTTTTTTSPTTTNLPRNTSTLTPKVPSTSTLLTSPTERHLVTPTKDTFLNKTSQHPNVSLTTTIGSGKRNNSAKRTRSPSPSPSVIPKSSGESHRTETLPPTSSHGTDTTKMFTSTETTKSTTGTSSSSTRNSTRTPSSIKTKSSTSAQSAARSKGSDLIGWVPAWAIALLVLASVILLLLIIIFIMLVVRWCCKKSKEVSEDPYVPENNSPPNMDPTYLLPIPINEQTNEEPPKNKTGKYVVNP